jgi:tRNA(His) 5'-end guanylyltransferase
MSCGGGHLEFSICIKKQYGENVSKRFFSETTWIIETKLPRNDHWKVLYKVCVFYANRKSKMATFLGSLVSTVLVVSEKKRFETFSP